MSDTPPEAAPPPAQPTPPSRGVQRLLLLLAAALGGFVLCAGLGLAAVVISSPGLRARLPLVGGIPSGPPPTAPDKYRDLPAGPVSISDSFALPSDRWDRSQTRVADGAYELRLENAEFDSYGLFLGAANVRDFDMAVDATFVAGDPVSEFGIRFRQSAPDEHLIFSISPNGYFRLARVSERSYTPLVDWTRDPRINTGFDATNRLRVVADGPSIRGFINDELVVDVTDDLQGSGQLTLGLVTFASGGLTVRFDNIAGFALEPAPLNDVQPTRVPLDEDFSDPAAARWSQAGATVASGAYEVFVAGEVISWQQPLPSGSSEVAGDFVLEVEATLLSGNSGGSAYGLMFGDGGSFDFYALMLLPEGAMILYRSGPGGGLLGPPVELPMINPGLDATNTIRVEVRGQFLRISINGQTLNDLELPPEVVLDGMAGVVVQSPDAEGVRVRFDNFRLEEVE